MAAQSSCSSIAKPPQEAKEQHAPSPDHSLSAYTKPDTDSEYTQGLSEEEDLEEEEDFTDSDFSSRKQKAPRNIGGQVEQRGRVDTPMTRKLRPVRGPDESLAAEETRKSQESKNDLPKNELGPVQPEYSRDMSEEEASRQLAEVQGMWEMAAILDFLSTFEAVLKLNLDFTAESLEDAIVRSPGQGILANIHMVLMLSITPRSQITERTWTGFLASKLYAQFIREGSSAFLNFFPRKGHESEDYASLPTAERVKALKSLCELCADHEGIRSVFDSILKPKKTKVQNGKSKAANLSIDDFRRVPHGEGPNGENYWYLDMWEQAGVRMYKDVLHDVSQRGSQQVGTYESGKYCGWPKSMFAGRKKKKAGKTAPKNPAFLQDSPSGKWSIVASNLEEFEALTLMLSSSRKRKSLMLGKRIRGEIMAELQQREVVHQKRQKAAEKLRVRLGDVIIDPEGRSGRSQRKRKVISYRFDAYDRLIEDSILASGIPEEEEGDDGHIEDERKERNGLVDGKSPQELDGVQPESPDSLRPFGDEALEFTVDASASDCELPFNRSYEMPVCEDDTDRTYAHPDEVQHPESSCDALHEMRNYIPDTSEGLRDKETKKRSEDIVETSGPVSGIKRNLSTSAQRRETNKTILGAGKISDKVVYLEDPQEEYALSSDG